jgi:hypothetical protein
MRKGCLAFAGHNPLEHARAAQIARVRFLHDEPEAFLTLLAHEVAKADRKYGTSLRVRLNMLSDLLWERITPDLFERFGHVRFYDYTKWPPFTRNVPTNYDLTYSASERTTDAQIKEWTNDGLRVAVVFNIRPREPMIDSYLGIDVIDGDADDDRWLNPQGVIVGLRAKGVMRKGSWAFVREVV